MYGSGKKRPKTQKLGFESYRGESEMLRLCSKRNIFPLQFFFISLLNSSGKRNSQFRVKILRMSYNTQEVAFERAYVN